MKIYKGWELIKALEEGKSLMQNDNVKLKVRVMSVNSIHQGLSLYFDRRYTDDRILKGLPERENVAWAVIFSPEDYQIEPDGFRDENYV